MLWEAITDALRLIGGLDPLVLSAAWRSLWISSVVLAIAAIVGIPLGAAMAFQRFPGSGGLVLTLRAAMGLPTVLIGLMCFALLSRRGPLGGLELLYTPWAIVVGELFLAVPIVAALAHGAFSAVDPRVGETAFALGAGRARRFRTYLSEARVGIGLAVLTAFARCFSELGIAMMVGGNIKHRTRTLATATALETSRGEFARGMAMGLILLVLAAAVAILMSRFDRPEKTP